MSVGSRNTACGHNDFCSVRLNGPIWWFILTHRYRLSLSQFTESVLIDSITPGHFCYAKAGVSRRKSVMPLRLLSNHQGLSVLPIFDNSATFVKNRSFQAVPRQKIAMNTLTSGMGVPCTGTLRASVLSDSWAFGASATNCLMRALVPLGEKSSESVPERVLPYRH